MMMTMKRISALLLVLLIAAPLYAQQGCTQSPEAPTDVLMAVGAAGAFYGSRVLGSLMARRSKANR
jgi:XrtJ-associated TM-motif-TM protein